MEQKTRSESNHATHDSHIKGLDGLRAIAATLVFAYHTWGHWHQPTIALDLFGARVDLTWLFHYGTEGVSIFFVLSGFLLSIPFWKAVLGQGRPVNVQQFFKRRFLRIYPAYLVALTIFALFFDVWHPLWDRLVIYATHLVLVHNFFEMTIFSDSSPLWSVATEFQMYLILPLLFFLIAWYIKKHNPPIAAAALLFTICGLVGYIFWSVAKPAVASLHLNPMLVQPDGNVLPHLPVIGLAYFSAGIAFGYVYLALKNVLPATWPPLVPDLAGAAFILFLVPVAQSGHALVGLDSVLWPRMALFYGAVVAAVALGGSRFGLTWFLELPPLRFLGAISYSFYLYHDFMLYLSFDRIPNLSLGSWLPNGTVKALLAFMLSVILATLSYYLIETRFHQSAKKTVAPATVSASASHSNGLGPPATLSLPVIRRVSSHQAPGDGQAGYQQNDDGQGEEGRTLNQVAREDEQSERGKNAGERSGDKVRIAEPGVAGREGNERIRGAGDQP